MSMIRWNPYDPFESVDRKMNRLIGQMRSIMDDSPLTAFGEAVGPVSDTLPLAIDMTSDDKQVIVRTALPGFNEEDVQVDVQGNLLTISAESKTEREDKAENWHLREMRFGKCSRSVMLPEDVQADKADASLENGVLTVKLPKQTPSPVQKIAVTARKFLGGNGSKKD